MVQEADVPVVGFIDDRGERHTFAAIAAGSGTFALPRPLVLAFAGGYRAADHYGDTSVVSVTTLINPVQQTRLMQRHDLYVKPLANMWALFGTLGHAVVEGYALDRDDAIAERRLVIERDGQRIGGTFDLLQLEDGSWHGKDYKVTSAYSVAGMKAHGVRKSKPEYHIQANIYARMIADADAREVVEIPAMCRGCCEPIAYCKLDQDCGVPPNTHGLAPFEHAGLEVASWSLVAWVRDWKADRGSKTMSVTPYPSREPVELDPIEIIPITLGKAAGVEQYLRERLIEYAASGMCDDTGLPRCSPSETWNGRRCKAYCAAAPVCAQIRNPRRRA